MRIISFIEEFDIIERILCHLGLWDIRNHDPPQPAISDSIPDLVYDFLIPKSQPAMVLIFYVFLGVGEICSKSIQKIAIQLLFSDSDPILYFSLSEVVFCPNGTYAGGSGSGTSAEQVDIANPPVGVYDVFVHGFATDGSNANYTLFSWAVPATPGSSNMSLTAPTAAVLGETDSITVDWFGLNDGTKHLGAVSHSDAGGVLGLTLVGVDCD